MANHKSAKKRARQAVKRRDRNRNEKSRTKSAVKGFRTALAAGDAEQTDSALRTVEGVLRRAASKGVIHKKNASRRISRLTKARNQLAT